MSNVAFTNIKGQVAPVMDGIMAVPEMVSLPEDVAFSLRLAIEELVVNVISYAYAEDEDGDLTVEVDRTDDVLSVTLADHGTPFNPLEHEDPDVSLSAEEREIGGLGIFLVRQMTDGVEYQYADGQNRITIRKNL